MLGCLIEIIASCSVIDAKSWDLPELQAVQQHVLGDVAVCSGGKHKADICHWLHSRHPDLTPVVHQHQTGGPEVSLASDLNRAISLAPCQWLY